MKSVLGAQPRLAELAGRWGGRLCLQAWARGEVQTGAAGPYPLHCCRSRACCWVEARVCVAGLVAESLWGRTAGVFQ